MTTKTLYFFSGFDDETGFPPEIAESLREHITERQALVFIASDPNDHSTTDYYAKFGMAQFSKAGIEFTDTHVLDNRKSVDECVALASNASVIFLMGGDTLSQYQFIAKSGLDEVLRQHHGIIAGISAGAINMAKFALLDETPKGVPPIVYRGIGLADITTYPHYSADDKDLLKKILLPFSHKINIYAMEDDSAIVIHGDKTQYIGNIYHIRRGELCHPEVDFGESPVPKGGHQNG